MFDGIKASDENAEGTLRVKKMKHGTANANSARSKSLRCSGTKRSAIHPLTTEPVIAEKRYSETGKSKPPATEKANPIQPAC